MTQQVTVRASITGEYSSAVDLGSLIKQINAGGSTALADGTGANLASEHWGDSVSVSASTNTDVDLQALTKPTGAALALTGVKALLIKAGASNPGNLTVQPGASNGWTSILGGTSPTTPIVPGGVLMLMAPSAAGFVVGASNKVLRIASAATAGTYTFDVMVVGIP